LNLSISELSLGVLALEKYFWILDLNDFIKMKEETMNYAYGNAGLHGLEKVIIESC
jgi:hypothetical protein